MNRDRIDLPDSSGNDRSDAGKWLTQEVLHEVSADLPQSNAFDSSSVNGDRTWQVLYGGGVSDEKDNAAAFSPPWDVGARRNLRQNSETDVSDDLFCPLPISDIDERSGALIAGLYYDDATSQHAADAPGASGPASYQEDNTSNEFLEHENIDFSSHQSYDTIGDQSPCNGVSKGRSSLKSRKRERAPRRPVSAFTLFYREEKAKMERTRNERSSRNVSRTQLSKRRKHVSHSEGTCIRSRQGKNDDDGIDAELNRIWQTLSPERRSFYEGKAQNEFSIFQTGSNKSKEYYNGESHTSTTRVGYIPSAPPPAAKASQGQWPPPYTNQYHDHINTNSMHSQVSLHEGYASGHLVPETSSYGPLPGLSSFSHRPFPYSEQGIPQPQWIDTSKITGPIQLPPPSMVTLADSDGQPRQYQVIYAAVSMTPESAHRYIMSMSAATQQAWRNHPVSSQAASNDVHSPPPATYAGGNNSYPSCDSYYSLERMPDGHR